MNFSGALKALAVSVEFVIVATATLGTVPAVGGYSNTAVSKKDRSDFTTVGIVTRVRGKSFAKRTKAVPLQTGTGVWAKDLVWVEPDAEVEVVDVKSNRIHVIGPAVVRMDLVSEKLSFHVYRGSYLIEASENETISLSHGDNYLFSAQVKGKIVVLSKIDQAQILCLSGSAEVWNPAIDGEKIDLQAGKFVASSTQFNHLQLKLPKPVDFAASKEFLSRFGETEISTAERSIAADDEKNTFVGSRTRKEVVAPLNEAHIERLKAKMLGKDVEDDDEDSGSDIPVAGGKRITLKELRAPASEKQGPSVEVKPASSSKLSSEELKWIEKLRKSKR